MMGGQFTLKQLTHVPRLGFNGNNLHVLNVRLMSRTFSALLLIAVTFYIPTSLVAATSPELDKILQDATRTNIRKPDITKGSPILAPEQESKQKSPAGEVRVMVTRFTFNGNNSISTEQLSGIVADGENKSLNFGELMTIVERVENYYKAAGYFLAQAYLSPQKIQDGSIEISVSEGRLGQARLEGESRVKAAVVYAYLDKLDKGKAVKLAAVERQILLINDLAGSSAKLDVQASEESGFTDIVISQELKSALSGRVELNNHGMPSTGQEHLGLFINDSSPLGLGDRLSGNAMSSNHGNLVSYGLNYELPVGANGWRISSGTSLSQYKIVSDAYKALNLTGTIHAYRIGLTYPFIRSLNRNVNLRLDAAHNIMNSDSSFGGNQNTSNVFNANIGSDWMDTWLGGSANHADVTMTRGKLSLGASALASDNNTDGNFSKVVLTIQREQNITNSISLQSQLIMQQALNNLDGSEKFSIGGPSTMPGYASGEASGDNAALLKLKVNWHIRQDTAISFFADFAHIKAALHPVAASDCNADPNVTNNRCHFSDAGFSVDWQGEKGITASMLMAWAITEKPNPADDKSPRIWANLGYNW